MASYKSSFDAPTRPDQTFRSRRLATYGPRVEDKMRHREADVAHTSGEVNYSTGDQRTGLRSHHTGLPRPSVHAPNSVTAVEAIPRVVAGPRMLSGKESPASSQPPLRGKSSRNVLRRKQSTVAGTQAGGAHPPVDRTESSSPTKWSQSSADGRPSIESSIRSADAYNEIFTRPSARAAHAKPRVIPELDRYRTRPEASFAGRTRYVDAPRLATQDLPPAAPQMVGTPASSTVSSRRYSGYSASPSTRFSESPGPGPYSRDTTPTSMSSQSPGIVAPLKGTPRLVQVQPTAAFSRPPITRNRAGSVSREPENSIIDAQGLPSLKEALTSSSSNSTVHGEGKKERKKKKGLPSSPPSPPPRKSSQKFKKNPRTLRQDASPVSPETPASQETISPLDREPTIPFLSPEQPAAPIRPSREGTPSLGSETSDMSVVQSNLTSLGYSPNKRSSLPRGTSPLIQPSRSQQSSRLPSRNPSPNPNSNTHISPESIPSGLGTIPDLGPPAMPSSTRSTSTRTPSPSIPAAKSRFGLFGRRTKTAPANPAEADAKEKIPRKGPVAGTGHEGYGKYAARGRSASAGVAGRSRDRSMSVASSSQESSISTRVHDPFFLERMSPVIIAGGSVVENRNASSDLSRTESNTSLALGRPSVESKVSSKTSVSREAPESTLWPSAMPRDILERTSGTEKPKSRRPSDSSEDALAKPTLALRRSMQRINNSTTSLNLPKPLNLDGMGGSPSVMSLQSSLMSDDSRMGPKIGSEKSRDGKLTKPKRLEKPEKRDRSPRKWNFFHRSQPTTKPQVEVAMPVTVGRPPVKSVPHYALLDSSDEQQEFDHMNLDDLCRDADADVTDLDDDELDAIQFGHYKENLKRIADLNIMMSAPVMGQMPERSPIIFSSPEPTIETPEMAQVELVSTNESPQIQQTEFRLAAESAPTRPSRLPQVGRIPKVVSARPMATPPQSFSRPFARLSTIQPRLDPVIPDKESLASGVGPSPEPTSSDATGLGLGIRQENRDSQTQSINSQKDFLAFSSRKDSEATTTSSSGNMSYVGTTAIIPEASAELAEDEVWDEYDDLIETADTTTRPDSCTSSQDLPFEYEELVTRRPRKGRAHVRESSRLLAAPSLREKSRERSLGRKSILTSSSVYSADMTVRMREALAEIPSPTTPVSFGDFLSGVGERKGSFQVDFPRKAQRFSQSSSRVSVSSGHRRSGSEVVTAIKERRPSPPVSQVNLRVGSMTVSKWLTFGHVLFSPAREALVQLKGTTKRHSVLVIDGLGNDDWSFYAAETYPTATFYNLSSTTPLPTNHRHSTAFPLTPQNHRQVQYTSPTHKFPFPSSTFHIVVIRFPTVMPESSYRNIVAESKRVLKPGGFLELAILDWDMMNMGTRARRAVRALKVKMQTQDPSVWLGSASDSILKIVGRRGFQDLKSCNVGVPVASPIHPPTSAKGKEREDLSLADMMRDFSHASDEGITKMVSKVGRWWYSRCYERELIEAGGAEEEIFADQKVLEECENWGATFKLVVAYAQKPLHGRKRGMSM